MVGLEIILLLDTEFDCQSSFHLDVTLTGVVSDHIGFLFKACIFIYKRISWCARLRGNSLSSLGDY